MENASCTMLLDIKDLKSLYILPERFLPSKNFILHSKLPRVSFVKAD